MGCYKTHRSNGVFSQPKMLAFLLLLVVASASAQDAAATECAIQCEKQFPYPMGTAGKNDFKLVDRDTNNQWSDGLNHSAWWIGPKYDNINHFQIMGAPNGKQQMALVYFKNKLIDVVKNSSECNEPIMSKKFEQLIDQDYCIWKCLGVNQPMNAPLNTGEDCSNDKLLHKLTSKKFTGWGDLVLSGRGYYERYSAMGPSCGQWTFSFRTNFFNSIRVVREDFDEVKAATPFEELTHDDYVSEFHTPVHNGRRN